MWKIVMIFPMFQKRIYEIKHEGVVPMSEMRVYINTFVDMLNEYRLKEINMGLYDSAITNLKKFPDYTFWYDIS